MWIDNKNVDMKGFSTPPPPPLPSRWRSAPFTPIQTLLEMNESPQLPATIARVDSFHVIHKVPSGDSPYVKAKHVQLIDKDPGKAVSLFWSAINVGDRVDSALKDMAIVMKQLDRTDEAIEAIKSFRHLCTPQAQESLDNVLIDLYKRGGRIEEHIELLHHKLWLMNEGVAFGGKKTKKARSQGKKFHVSIEQERSRLLGNLGWAYMQRSDYETAEEIYRKALSIEPDKNKQCNLAICLMNRGQIMEAKSLLQTVTPSSTDRELADPFIKSFDRAYEMLTELESKSSPNRNDHKEEIKTGICRSFTQPISINSKPVASASPIEEPLLLKRGSYVCEDRLDSFGFGKGRWNSDIGREEKGGCHSCRKSLFADKWKKENCSPNLFESENGISGGKNVEPFSKSRMEDGGTRKNIRTFGFHNYSNRSPKLTSNERKCGLQSPSDGDWRRRSWDNDANKNQATTTPSKPPIFIESKCGDCRKISRVIEADSAVIVTDSASKYIKGEETPEAHNGTDSTAESSTSKYLCSSFRSGKSWADMVEEEEELLRECKGNSISTWEYPSFQTPCKSVDRWNDEKFFRNENMDSNIIGSTPELTTQPRRDGYTQTLIRKLELVNLKEEEHIKTTASCSYSNPPARRTLAFGKTDSADLFRPSPLRKQVLFNCEGDNTARYGNSSKPVGGRSRRLQVFQEITPWG